MADSQHESKPQPEPGQEAQDRLIAELRHCRLCQDKGLLPEARPIFQWSGRARIGVFGQAPGNRAHLAGRPFADPSGIRLRQWLGVSEAEFYDADQFAILPMAFCFPGYDARGSDRPPPRLCAETWRSAIMNSLVNQLDLHLMVGSYSQHWHDPQNRHMSLTGRLEQLLSRVRRGLPVQQVPLPHPSWRNNVWLKRNPWFEAEIVPWLQAKVRQRLGNRA